jgi:two-component system nitrogen regulation response regulator GlnG
LLRRGEGQLHDKVIAAAERVLFARVLRQTHGHRSKASELLGLDRSTLRNRLRALGLTVDKMLTEKQE